MNVDTKELSSWVGRTASGPDGGKIGKIEDIYLDEETRKPEWLAVSTGMFGSRLSFVPITGASVQGDNVVLNFSKDQVKDAPNAEADGALSQDEEARLYQHYGMNYSESRSDSGLPEGGYATGTRTERTARHADDDESITRSEEELRLSKSTQEAGRVRLRKWVETEHVQQSVPVSRETVHVEREAINGDVSGATISEDEVEVVLHEETVSADKRAVAKERITLDKETVTDQQQIDVDLRKEHVEVDGDTTAGQRRR